MIDDEPQIRRFLDISLRAQGYVVATAESGRAGLAELAAHGADLIVLDIGLPDLDGHEVLGELRQWSQVPVIMLTVRDGEAEKVAALDGGANDYVTKPFGVQELMARIRSLLRTRIVPADTAMPLFDDGHLHVDLGRREVTLAGEPVALGLRNPRTTTVFVDAPFVDVVRAARLRTADPRDGDPAVVTRQRFWNEEALRIGPVAPPLLTAAERLASADERLHEVGSHMLANLLRGMA